MTTVPKNEQTLKHLDELRIDQTIYGRHSCRLVAVPH